MDAREKRGFLPRYMPTRGQAPPYKKLSSTYFVHDLQAENDEKSSLLQLNLVIALKVISLKLISMKSCHTVAFRRSVPTRYRVWLATQGLDVSGRPLTLWLPHIISISWFPSYRCFGITKSQSRLRAWFLDPQNRWFFTHSICLAICINSTCHSKSLTWYKRALAWFTEMHLLVRSQFFRLAN